MSPQPDNSTADLERLAPDELHEAWPALSDEERLQGFALLTPEEAEDFVARLPSRDAAKLMSVLPVAARQRWLRLLPPDDVADIVQALDDEQREATLALLDDAARNEVRALLVYAEDVAGGLMNPRYARLREDMTAGEAIAYLRAQKQRTAEMIYYGYVVDAAQRLRGVVSFRELVTARADTPLRELMTTDLVTVPDTMDQEAVSHIFARHDLICIPVVDADAGFTRQKEIPFTWGRGAVQEVA